MPASYWNQESDPYQIPGSTLLKNLPDIRDASALETFEQRATAMRVDEVLAAIAGMAFDFRLWQTIHRILFQDVYAWAGQIRSVQLAKDRTVFAMPDHVESQADRIFRELAAEDLQRLDRSSLASRMAYYFGELNALHPFREGNGRTQKLLFDEIARRAGYSIEWDRLSVDALLRAVIAAFHKQNYSLLNTLFESSLQQTLRR